MMQRPRRFVCFLILVVWRLLAPSPVSAQTILFADNFNRTDNLNISAATNGMSGLLITNGTLTVSNVWLEPVDVANSAPTDAQILTNQLKMGGNLHTVHVVPNRNFANDFLAGTFSVS